jgi:hypothetical protein
MFHKLVSLKRKSRPAGNGGQLCSLHVPAPSQEVCVRPKVEYEYLRRKFLRSLQIQKILSVARRYLDNQEDSLVYSQGAIDRGLFNGCKFTFYRTELEQKEEFGNPDAATTTDIKSASYEKLENGIIKVGTKVVKGDAIIGKYVRLSKAENDSKFLYSDRSIIYKDDEPAIVHNVIVDRNEDDERFAKVALRKLRPVVTGDKFSSRSGQKGICALTMRDSDMPFIGATGERMSVLFNCHGLNKWACELVTACKSMYFNVLLTIYIG